MTRQVTPAGSALLGVSVGKTTSHFDYAGPLTEAVLLGTVAIRVRGETVKWDSAALKVIDNPAADALVRKAYRKGWEPTWIAE